MKTLLLCILQGFLLLGANMALGQQNPKASRSSEKPPVEIRVPEAVDVLTPTGPEVRATSSSLTIAHLSIPRAEKFIGGFLLSNNSDTARYLYLVSHSCHTCLLQVSDLARWLAATKRPFTFQVLVLKPEKVSTASVRALLHAASLDDNMANYHTAGYNLRAYVHEQMFKAGLEPEQKAPELIINAKTGIKYMAGRITQESVTVR